MCLVFFICSYVGITRLKLVFTFSHEKRLFSAIIFLLFHPIIPTGKPAYCTTNLQPRQKALGVALPRYLVSETFMLIPKSCVVVGYEDDESSGLLVCLS